MLEKEQIRLSTNELVAALALCGYDQIASQVLNEQGLINNEEEFPRFVEESETALKKKGYWDDNRNTRLAKGLEDLLYLLVHSKRKIRCIHMRKKRVLLIHSLNNNHSLIQSVQTGEHSFSFHKNNSGFYSILRNHFGVEDIHMEPDGWQPIQMTDGLIEELHASDPRVLQAIEQDESQDQPMRDFAGDFLKNGQEFDNISFMISNYVKDQSEFDDIQFLLPGNNHIWHMNYENVERNRQVFLEPIPINLYFNEINLAVQNFFSE